jgi:hypothetical protein
VLVSPHQAGAGTLGKVSRSAAQLVPDRLGVNALQLSGTLLDVEHKVGNGTDRATGGSFSWDYEVLHVLEGREVHKVRLPSEIRSSDLPFIKGETVELDVTVPNNTKLMYQA